MINRYTLVAFTAALALTGCAKITAATSAAGSAAHAALVPSQPDAPDFSSGPTAITVTHIRTLADDGAPIYVTVDGTDAGILAAGQTVVLHLPAAKHKIGGYARSLIGRVTIAPVEVTSTTNTVQHVNYSVTNAAPAFKKRPATPVVTVSNDPEPAPAAKPATPAATTTPATTAPATATPAATTPATTTTTPAATSTVPSAPTTITTPATSSATSTTTTTPSTTSSTTTTTPSTTTTTPATTTTTPSTTTTTPATTTTPSE